MSRSRCRLGLPRWRRSRWIGEEGLCCEDEVIQDYKSKLQSKARPDVTASHDALSFDMYGHKVSETLPFWTCDYWLLIHK